MGLFGKSKPADPKVQVQEWSRKLRKEGYGLDRQINAIKREEAKVTRSIKEAAKKGDKASCRILAKEVVASRKAVSRLYTAKANLSSVDMQMKQQAAQVRLAGSLQQSTEVMTSMQKLVKIPEMQKTMMEMSKEMMKAGVFEEMMEDAMEGLEDQDELEEETQEQVDKILAELTLDTKKKVAAAPTLAPEATIDLPEVEATVEEEEGEEELEEMQQRLQALKS